MSTSMIPFESNNLPAYLTTETKVANELGAVGGGFDVISIKGKVFAVKSDGESKPIMKDGQPAPFIDVVLVKVWPIGKDHSKVYYAKQYVEGSDAKPDCYSNDGVAPGVNATTPQSTNCATCKHNQWGSRITDDGRKAKSCQDSKRLAVAAPGRLDTPMLIRVPATSLNALATYGQTIANRRAKYYGVLTRIGFDYTKAYPALTFTPIGFLDQNSVAEIEVLRESPQVSDICGQTETLFVPNDDGEPFESPKAEPTKPAKEAKPKAAKESKAQAALEALTADLPSTPAATPAAPVAPATQVIEVDDDADLAAAIGALDMDD